MCSQDINPCKNKSLLESVKEELRLEGFIEFKERHFVREARDNIFIYVHLHKRASGRIYIHIRESTPNTDNTLVSGYHVLQQGDITSLLNRLVSYMGLFL